MVEIILSFQLAYDTYRTYLQIRVAILTADGYQGNGNGEVLALPQYVDSGEVHKHVVDPPPPYKA